MKKIIFFLLLIATTTACTSNKFKIYFQIDDASGLSEGNKVTLSGLEVGKITNIELDESYKICMTSEFNKINDFPIDSKFSVISTDFLGSKGIQVDLGSSNQFIKSGDSVHLEVDKINENIEFLKQKTEELINNNPVVNHLDSLLNQLEKINKKLDKQSQK